MALNAQIILIDSDNNWEFKPGGFDITVGSHLMDDKMTIGSVGEETLAINGDITSGNGPGACVIRNYDTTNYVQVGTTTADYGHRVDPEAWVFFLLDAGVTDLYLLADTASCVTQVRIWERGS